MLLGYLQDVQSTAPIFEIRTKNGGNTVLHHQKAPQYGAHLLPPENDYKTQTREVKENLKVHSGEKPFKKQYLRLVVADSSNLTTHLTQRTNTVQHGRNLSKTYTSLLDQIMKNHTWRLPVQKSYQNHTSLYK
ncbi:hypothetical protein N431DRAFT_448893 [Stipitochalara longipes BDJ]|nr:hypothetical protein N431DRAFT_448893 [Stipitochalara longipes BDJ]